jgi:hypothetical protein
MLLWTIIVLALRWTIVLLTMRRTIVLLRWTTAVLIVLLLVALLVVATRKGHVSAMGLVVRHWLAFVVVAGFVVACAALGFALISDLVHFAAWEGQPVDIAEGV